MKRILVFGTGGLAHYLVNHKKENVTIEAYINSVEKDKGDIEGVPIIGVDEIDRFQYDYIVIAFSDVKKGLQILCDKGVKKEKIVGYHYNGAYIYSDNPYQQQFTVDYRNSLNSDRVEEIFDVLEKKYYLCSMNIQEQRNVIEKDFVREQTLALLAKEIKRKNLGGNIAELGVFKGEFAKKLNKLFPEKRFFLFDTFEGFSEKDLKNDKEIGWGETLERFKATAENKVLSLMPYPEQCVIKKGYFPDTFNLTNERFSLVSIDADLYDPIKAGLEIFYPRLVSGGYIMVHDYNNIVFQGAKKAVKDYCDSMGISYVPISDMAGTIIITK